MRSPSRRFRSNQAGVVAVEFAFIVPVMLMLCFAGYAATRLVRASMKAWVVAQTMSDLVAQQAAVTSLQLKDFCTGATLIMAPYTGAIGVTFASVTNVTSGSSASVTAGWVDANDCSGSPMTSAAAVALATPYVPNAMDSVIVARVVYTYSFPQSYWLPKSFTFTRTTFSKPRNGSTVTKI